MFWRPMRDADLPFVNDVAARVHAAHPERPEIFAERLALFPAGCHVLAMGDRAVGYAASHPWMFGAPPSLDTLIGAPPPGAETLLLHDVALMEEARGGGAGARLLRTLADVAGALGASTMSLVAVNGSAPYWRRQGFDVVDDPTLAAKLASYGDDARYMARAIAI